MTCVSYRFATEDDVPAILELIKELAEYEKAADQVVATEELLRSSLFDQKRAEVLLAVVDGGAADGRVVVNGRTVADGKAAVGGRATADGRVVGFALFFHSFSTWLGRAGIFLEDLFVLPEERGKGYGKGLLQRLAQVAVERECGRLEWNCLDWNQPSIDFYLSLNARQMDEWTTYRLEGETLRALAQPGSNQVTVWS